MRYLDRLITAVESATVEDDLGLSFGDGDCMRSWLVGMLGGAVSSWIGDFGESVAVLLCLVVWDEHDLGVLLLEPLL